MARTTTRRSMTTSLLGPKVEEMEALMANAVPGSRIHVDHQKYYDQFDAGSLTFTVEVSS